VLAAWAAVVLVSARTACPEAPLDRTRRLYDFKPASSANPVVATVDECWIQIPLAELRGHLAAELGEAERRSLTPEGARRQLDRLIDEHLILMEAYRQKADESERAVAMLGQTRKMLLGEFLTAQEADAKAATADEQDRLRRQLLERAFARAVVTVSNEGYAALQEAAKAGTAELPPPLRDRPLAAFQDTRVTVGDALAVYLALPAPARPRLDSRPGLEALLKHLLEYELLAAEAVARGIDRTRAFQEKVELNRNAIVRMWSQDALTRRVRERISREGTPRDDHDALREAMRAEQARALRAGRRIVIDEAALTLP
jgi:hypothetical protein